MVLDDYLSSTGRDFGTDNVSVACWINLDDWDNYDGLWSNRNNTGTSIGFQCRTDGVVGNVALFSDFGSSTVTSTATGLSTSKWHYVVCTMNRSGNQVIYVDGVAKSTDDISSHSAISMSNVDVPFFIGKDQGNAEADGNITEFGIWDRVLTSLEVASLYNQGMPTNLLVNRNDYQSGNPTVFNTKQVDFDGTDDYLSVSDSDSVNVTTNDFSVSAWIKTTEANGLIFAKRADAGYEMGLSNGIVSYYIKDAANNAAFDTEDTITVNDGEWHHIAWVFDRSGLGYRYIDGVNLGTNNSLTGATGSLSNTMPLGIMARLQPSPNSFIGGELSQVGIWNSSTNC